MSKILLVEDGLIIAFHLRKTLEDNGYNVIAHLTKGEEVFDYVEKLQPDLILLDIMLAGEMTGVEAAKELRKISRVPIIFMSALTDDKTLDAIATIGNAIRISKPFERDFFAEEIEEMLMES